MIPSVLLSLALVVSPAILLAQTVGCSPPIRPSVPSDPHDVQAYSDLIREDFETCIADFGTYLICLDVERLRVFGEGQEVTIEYGRFQNLTSRLGSVLAQ